jgi:ABC-type amino acid transport substrate-binding protein
MKLTISAVVFVVALAGLSHARNLAQITASKRLVVGISESDYPPFYFRDSSGKMTGFDVEFAMDMAKSLGVSLEFLRIQGGYPKMPELLNRGQVDVVVAAYRINLNRAKQIAFSDPYQTEKHVFASLRKNERIFKQMVNDIKLGQERKHETSVGLLQKTTYLDYFERRYKGSKIVYFNDVADLMKSLKTEKIDFAYLEECVLNNWLDHHSEDLLFVSKFFNPTEVDDLAMAVSKDNTHFLLWLNLFITEKKKDKRLVELTEKYLNRSLSPITEFRL